MLSGKGRPAVPATPSVTGSGPSIGTPVKRPSQLIVIGISTGGPNALKEVLPQLPGDIGVPVLIVQHMPPVFTKSLADSLNSKCALEVIEGQDGQVLTPNVVTIAPGGKQMKVILSDDKKQKVIKITDDPAENGCRPSVDYLFRSIAQVYDGRVTAVIMTGMGSDGKLGMRLLKRNGATTLAQDERSCVVYGMPKEVVEAGLADLIVPLHSMAQAICKTVTVAKAVLI